jgi:hypothetical protein
MDSRSAAHLYSAGDRFQSESRRYLGGSTTTSCSGSRAGVVAGDTLDFGRGLEIPSERLRKGVTREQIAEGLRSLLSLPVAVVFPAHGAATDRAAFERALSRLRVVGDLALARSLQQT